MANTEQLSALKQYGSQIITGAKPGSLQTPVFELSPAEQISFFDSIKAQNDQEIKTGFSYALKQQAASSFPKLNDAEKLKYREMLLDYLLSIKNEKELTGILASVDSVYRMSEKAWPELIKFVLSSESPELDFIRGNTLAAMSFIRDQAFIEEHSKELVTVIHRFLNSKLNLPKAMFLSILTLCQSILEMTEDLFNSIWEVAIEIAIDNENYRSVFPAMQILSEINKEKQNITAKPVKSITDIFTDIDSDLESRLTTIIPLLRLFPFLDDDTVQKIIPASIEALSQNYYDGMIIIEHLEECDIELLGTDTVNAIYAFLSLEIEGERKNAALALFAPFADQIINEIEESQEKFLQSIIASLKGGDVFSAIVASTALRSIIHRLEKPDNALFKALLPHLTSTDENLLIEANKTARELMETGIYSTSEYEKEVIALYPQFKSAGISQFSTLLTALINSDEEPGLSLAEPAYDFALPFLSKECSLPENSLALDLFATLTEVSNEFTEDHVTDCLEIADKILNGDDGKCYPSAAAFLSVVAVSFTEISKEAILKLLPRMVSIIKGEVVVEPKQLKNVALSTSDIVREFDLRDTASELAETAVRMVSDNNLPKKIIECGAQILGIIAKSLLPEDALKVFTAVTEILPILELVDAVEELLGAMKRILKKYKVVNIEAGTKIIEFLFNGSLKALPPIHSIEDNETYVFAFIKSFILRFKAKSVKYIERLIPIVDVVDGEVIPCILEPIEAAIDNKLLDEEAVKNLLKIITDLISPDDSEVATSLITAVTSINRSYPHLIDIPKILEILSLLWNNESETNEDPMLPMAIAMLTLEISAKSESDENIDIELIKNLLEILPLSPEYCDLESIICNVKEIANHRWAVEKLLIPLGLFMTRVCLMKKSEIEAYEVSAGIIPNLREKLKALVKENSELDKLLKEEFSQNVSGLANLLK